MFRQIVFEPDGGDAARLVPGLDQVGVEVQIAVEHLKRPIHADQRGVPVRLQAISSVQSDDTEIVRQHEVAEGVAPPSGVCQRHVCDSERDASAFPWRESHFRLEKQRPGTSRGERTVEPEFQLQRRELEAGLEPQPERLLTGSIGRELVDAVAEAAETLKHHGPVWRDVGGGDVVDPGGGGKVRRAGGEKDGEGVADFHLRTCAYAHARIYGQGKDCRVG